MITKIPITKARVHLGEIMKRVRVNKEQFIIEKDGYPIAGILDIDEFEDYLGVSDKELKKHIECSASEYKSGKTKLARDVLDNLKKLA